MPPLKPWIKQEESQSSVMQKYYVARVKLEVKGRITLYVWIENKLRENQDSLNRSAITILSVSFTVLESILLDTI